MDSWKKTSCVLCAQNCGLEVKTDGARITSVRPDKDNPRSQGYVCRKGMSIAFFQHHDQRLTHPLKKVGGSFEKISWDQALDEIAERLKKILDAHGPRAVAYMGGGGQGCHFEAGFGRALLNAMGSQYHYNSMAQELTGMFWVHGRCLGKQYIQMLPDERNTDMLVAVGWNGWMSHQMAQARRVLKESSEHPDKLLVVIDPRKSETAARANIHLPIRPGTDAIFTRAVIAMILAEGWHNQQYLDRHVSGWNEARPLFENFDYRSALRVCELDYEQVRDFARLLTTRKSSFHADLGTLMNRHSTATSYLQIILLAICGRIGVPGGNIIPGALMPLGAHSDERKPATWRTTATDFPAIMGYFPPNVLPEEISSGRDDRVRAVIVSGSNPLRSYADTTAYERAFAQLDLLVTVEVAMSETAALSHYILPAATAYEKWDASFFTWNFPEVFFQMRRPVAKPEGELLEESEIFTRLAERMGYVPDIPTGLIESARTNRMKFGMELMGFVSKNPSAMKVVPFVLARTLGPALGSSNLAALWGILQTTRPAFRENAARAGFEPGPEQADKIFQAILDHPEGLWIGKCDPDNNLASLKTADGKVCVSIPELFDEVRGLVPEAEEDALRTDPAYPLILSAGRHHDTNSNTMMRDPAWNRGRRAGTMLMHPDDAESLGFEDGERVRVTTDAGSEEAELEVNDTTRPGCVIIPHGFGLVYNGKAHGPNANRLAKNTHRDPVAATPLHRYVPCRVEPLTN